MAKTAAPTPPTAGPEMVAPPIADSTVPTPGFYDLDRIPELQPDFLYGLLASAWAESNQLVHIDHAIAAQLSSKMRDDKRYIDDQETFDQLIDRTYDSPNRGRRLRKMVVDAVNGLPDSTELSLLDEIVKLRIGHEVRLRPTAELIEQIYRLSFGWGPLEPYMEGDTITEIMVDRFDSIFVERTIPGSGSRLVHETAAFESAGHLERFIHVINQQSPAVAINFQNPTIDMSLPDGSRVNMTIPPITRSPTITIRRKRERFYDLDELQSFGSFSPEMREFLHQANLAGANLMTYGPTGSGKTTLLTALLDDKPTEKRLVIIEDTPEINLSLERHPNIVWLLTNAQRSTRDLVRNALRMRPDHLIVGETRDATAYDLIQAFNTGQAGSASTLHARDARSALTRLTNLVRQAESAPGEEPARRMVADAVHLLVNAARLGDGNRRVMSIEEVRELDAGFNFQFSTVFEAILEGRNPQGHLAVRFRLNPNYVMGPEMSRLFLEQDLDPDRWTGPEARAAGLSPKAGGYTG
jgi:Flp pilus assembly CpaF family ATPase